jgi:hypothetical protein
MACWLLTLSVGLSTALAATLPATVLYEDSGPTVPPSSLRGLALSPSGSQIYGGFIQGASSTSQVLQISTSTGLPTAATGSLNAQPKGVAVDDRGYVYATLNNSAGATTQKFEIYANGSLTTPDYVITTQATAAKAQLAGAAVWDDVADGKDYLYLSFNKGAAVIERYDVTNPAAAFLDTTWAASGVFNLAGALGNSNAYLNGITVAADGTIYAAGGVLSTSRGDSVFEISSGASPTVLAQNNSVPGAMDVALYHGTVYATEYGNTNPQTVAELAGSNLSSVGNLNFSGVPLITNSSTDSGFSGIDINPSNGLLYVANQGFNATGQDLILVSQLPEPASWGLAIMAVLGFVGWRLTERRRRHS